MLAQARIVADRSLARAALIDCDAGFPTEDVELLHTSGLLAAPLSTDRGGHGLGLEPGRTPLLLDVLAVVGRGNLALGRLYEGHVNALVLVQAFGTPSQADDTAAAARIEGRLFGVWNSEDAEPGAGVRIDPDGDRFRLSGAKTFASGAGHITRALVTATLPDGRRQMCLLPMDTAPATVSTDFWQPLGMRASASHRIAFHAAVVGKHSLIGAPDDYIREPLFRGGAIRFAAVQVGGAQALLDAWRAYIRLAARSEEPLQQERAGLAALAVEGCRLWLQAAAATYDAYLVAVDSAPTGHVAAEAAEALVRYANLTRSAVEQACLEILELAERSVGARGLLRPQPIERLIRDLRMYLRQPASDQTLLGIGRHVLQQSTPSDRLWQRDW